jgi:hypothetical protein
MKGITFKLLGDAAAMAPHMRLNLQTAHRGDQFARSLER